MTAEAREALRSAMDRAGIDDIEMRAGIAAIVAGECDFQPRRETGYSRTSNERIRAIFGARVADLTETQLTTIKRHDELFFERVYGSGNSVGRLLGNTRPGDGWRYVGRGMIQITGRDNYTYFCRKIGHPEIIDAPERANEIPIAAALAVAYIVDRYNGRGWEAMKRAVGNPVDGDRKKDMHYADFLRSGEFARPAAVPEPPEPDPEVEARRIALDDIVHAVRCLQQRLDKAGFNPGPADGAVGPLTQAAAITAWRQWRELCGA